MPLTSERDKKTQHRRHAAEPRFVRGSWFELVIFFLTAAGMYLIAALFDSAWTGASGRHIGAYLRGVWGGALLVPLLFWLYLCLAWFVRFRVPRPLGQILGTLQLYLSIAFMLGLFRKVGWNSTLLLAEPGRVGEGLAHFFVLNLGVLGTVLVSFASLFLAGLFFGSRFSSFLSMAFMARLGREAPPKPSAELKEREKEPQATRHREGERGARLVRHASPGGQPFDPLKPVGTLIAFDKEEDEGGGVGLSGSEARISEAEEEREEPAREAEAGAVSPVAAEAPEAPEPETPLEDPEVPANSEPCRDEGEESVPAPEDEPVPETPAPESPAKEADAQTQTAVEILDSLLASLEAGEFDVPVPHRREISVDRPAVRRPPVEDSADLSAPSDAETVLEDAASGGGAPSEGRILDGPDEGMGGERKVIEVNSTPKVGAEERLKEIRERLVATSPEAEVPVDGDGDEDGRDTAVQEVFPDVVLPEDGEERRFRAGVFPPPLDILGPSVQDRDQDNALELADRQAEVIVDTLQNFGVKATVAHIVVGPSVI